MSDTAAPALTWRDGPIYWVVIAVIVGAIGAVLGLWFMADYTIRRDISYPEITDVGAIVFNCEPGHRVGAQIWLYIEANGTPETEARACFDFSKRRWYLKNREQYVPFGK